MPVAPNGSRPPNLLHLQPAVNRFPVPWSRPPSPKPIAAHPTFLSNSGLPPPPPEPVAAHPTFLSNCGIVASLRPSTRGESVSRRCGSPSWRRRSEGTTCTHPPIAPRNDTFGHLPRHKPPFGDPVPNRWIPLWISAENLRSRLVDSLGSPMLHRPRLADPQGRVASAIGIPEGFRPSGEMFTSSQSPTICYDLDLFLIIFPG